MKSVNRSSNFPAQSGAASRVLLFNTEGATAPALYASLAGVGAAEVLLTAEVWLTAFL